MKDHALATVINFCSNESRFLPFCIEEASRFARQILIVVSDHFFDGTPEHRDLLEQIYRAFPACEFIEYPFLIKSIPQRILKNVGPSHFWHSLSRLLSVAFLHSDIESVLFLDADEIPDGKRCAEWLECGGLGAHDVIKFSNYWYFREARFRAMTWEDSIVLVQKKVITPKLLLHREERNALYDGLAGPKRRYVTGLDGLPMFHHYSWVRTKEEMMRKVRTWGHRGDRDWNHLVEREFSQEFQGVDFVHGYRFETVPPAFSLSLLPPLFAPKGQGNVVRLTGEHVLAAIRPTRRGLIFRSF